MRLKARLKQMLMASGLRSHWEEFFPARDGDQELVAFVQPWQPFATSSLSDVKSPCQGRTDQSDPRVTRWTACDKITESVSLRSNAIAPRSLRHNVARIAAAIASLGRRSPYCRTSEQGCHSFLAFLCEYGPRLNRRPKSSCNGFCFHAGPIHFSAY